MKSRVRKPAPKEWAFYIDDNGEWQKLGMRVVKERERKEPGKWRSKEYYSTHFPPSVRLKMHVRKSPKGKFTFAYNPKQNKELERLGGGESLAHYLYKKTISQLSYTTLRIKKNRKDDIEIKIISSKTEKEILTVAGKRYYLDVYINFTSDCEYQLKWGGVLGIEVYRTHAVPDSKREDLKLLGIPLVEVKVSEKFAYTIPDAETSPEKESDYIDFLKGRLSEYLWSKVLIDPKTKEYLEHENKNLNNRLSDVENELNFVSQEMEEKENIIQSLEHDVKIKHELMVQSNSKLKEAEKEITFFKKMNLFQFIWYKVFGRKNHLI